MVSITLSVPEDLKHEMDSFPEINWSAVAREAIKKRIMMMEKFKEFMTSDRFSVSVTTPVFSSTSNTLSSMRSSPV